LFLGLKNNNPDDNEIEDLIVGLPDYYRTLLDDGHFMTYGDVVELLEGLDSESA
jgi:hypothetical protein